MRRPTLFLLTCLLGNACAVARAGDAVTLRFGAGPRPAAGDTLRPKLLIAEFDDPTGSGLGRSVTRILWREALVAMADYEAKRIALVELPKDSSDPTGARLAELTDESEAPLGIWGSVEEEDGIWVSAILYATSRAGDLRLRLEDPKSAAPEEEGQTDWIEIPLGRTHYDFKDMPTSRKDLFDRKVITKGYVIVHTKPDPAAPSIVTIKPENILQAVDMEGAWFRVMLDDGTPGYVESSEVHVLPKLVQIESREAVLRVNPGKSNPAIKQINEPGAYEVLDMRFRFDGGFWYKIRVGREKGWVHSTDAMALFSLPMIHFITGLERFAARRYNDADVYLQQFLKAPGAAGSPANLSTAQQLLGAARIMRKPVLRLDESALEPFDKAVELNPSDPAAYLARCMATLGILRDPLLALGDIDKALEHGGAAAAGDLLLSLERTAGSRMGLQMGMEDAVEEIERIKHRHGIQ